MYRFLLTPKWIGFHLLVLVGIVAMINLGLWQLRRLDERQTFNTIVEARYDEPPEPFDELLAEGVDPDDVAWRPVVVSGTYQPDGQVLIVNRSQNGRAGDNVVLPLELDDGTIVLVNRGFMPLGLDIPPAPTGYVEIIGRLRPSEERRLGQLSDADEGDLDVAQRVDIERLSRQIEGELFPMYVDAVASDPADTKPFPEPVIPPDLGEGSHFSYAMQWFFFSMAVATGWVLAVRHSVRSRQRQTA